MELSDEARAYLGPMQPLSDAEIQELSIALRRLAAEGIPVPRHLMRHALAEEGVRHYGSTLDVVPAALDILGTEREKTVVGLVDRFERAVRENREREPSIELDPKRFDAYFAVVFFLSAAKPMTKESAMRIADFLRSDYSEVHEHAAEMLEGSIYLPVIIDRLLENVATFGIRQFPNRQARALASFANVPEVRSRLMGCLRSQVHDLRHVAILTFAFVGEKAGEVVEAELFRIAGDEEDELQSQALSALREIARNRTSLRHLALRLMKSDKFRVRGNAIWCLDEFSDQECIDALLGALLDEGGHDFDNAGDAANALLKMPLGGGQTLPSLINSFKSLLEREDKRYERLQARFRKSMEELADKLKVLGKQLPEGKDELRYSSPETLLAVARLFAKLGKDAQPAAPIIRSCLERPYISRATDVQEWQDILKTIEA